jgi:para-nitrobenzyl esterase
MRLRSGVTARLLCLWLVLALGGCARTAPGVPDVIAAAELANGRVIHQQVAQTTSGHVAGRVAADGLKIFLGIPYAAPPVGALRFERPVAPERWTGLYPALAFGPVFPQIYDKTEPSSLYFQDEDCLRLNVWTPAADEAERPVMVFIHGGGYLWGSSMDPLYDGANLARRGKIVVVSFNYRMGALGYLDLSTLGGDAYADSGNLAVLDQVAALRWVHDNIANFGGDPANVTIFGESAGAGSVTTLLTVPPAQGLFRRVIAQSGAFRITRSPQHARDVTRRFMELAQVTDLTGLKALSPSKLLDAQAQLIKEAGLASDRLFGPVRDGRLVPQDPLRAVADGCAQGVDLLTGTTEDEACFWIKYESLLPYIPATITLSFTPDTKEWDTETRDHIIDHYKRRLPDASSGDVALAIATDFFFRMPQIHLAEAQAPHGNTWMYLFTWDSPVENGLYGARHALELRFVFDNLDPDVGPAPPVSLIDAMQEAWLAFAATGRPTTAVYPCGRSTTPPVAPR